MAEIIRNEELILDYVSHHVKGFNRSHLRGAVEAVGFRRGGALRAGIIFTNFKGFDVTVTVGCKNRSWISRENLRFLFSLVFNDWNQKRVTAVICRDEKGSRGLSELLGFKLEGVMRQGFDGEDDAMIYGMLKSECRWIDG